MINSVEYDFDWLEGVYFFFERQKVIGERIEDLLSACPSQPLEGYEPFACESPCVPPIGGDD